MKRKSNKQNGDYSLAHVLYQKLGNDWYAFTEVDGDCFMSKVDAEQAAQPNAGDTDTAREEQKQTNRRRRAA